MELKYMVYCAPFGVCANMVCTINAWGVGCNHSRSEWSEADRVCDDGGWCQTRTVVTVSVLGWRCPSVRASAAVYGTLTINYCDEWWLIEILTCERNCVFFSLKNFTRETREFWFRETVGMSANHGRPLLIKRTTQPILMGRVFIFLPKTS